MGGVCTWLAGFALAGGLFLTWPARAAELSVEGPAACPDASELAFRVERALGMPLADSAALRFNVRFEAPGTPGSPYTARLAAQGSEPTAASTERVIRARDCARLGDAVSVAIALAIGSSPLDAEPAPTAEEEMVRTRAGDTGSAAYEPHGAPATTAAGGTAWSPALAARLLADSGSLPRAGLGVGIGAALRGRKLALDAQATLLFGQHVALAEPTSAAGAPGADLSLLIGSLSACVAPFGSFEASFAAVACAGWELGRLSAEGTGVQTPRSVSQWWTAPRLAAGLSWAVPASPLRLGLELSAAAPLKRDDFFLRELGNVHRAPMAVGRLALGVDVSF